MAQHKDTTPALVKEIIKLRGLKMREILDCLRAFEFFKNCVQFSLGIRGATPPFSHMPPWSAQIKFHLLNLTSIFHFYNQNPFTLTAAICVRYLSSCEVRYILQENSGKFIII